MIYPIAPCQKEQGIFHQRRCLYYRDRWNGVEIKPALCTITPGGCPQGIKTEEAKPDDDR